MADLSNLNALASFYNVFCEDRTVFFLLLGILGIGFRSSIRSIARCLMVLLLMPLLILTTVLNYRLRQAGKEILPLDFLKYLCSQEEGSKGTPGKHQGKVKAKSDVNLHTRSI